MGGTPVLAALCTLLFACGGETDAPRDTADRREQAGAERGLSELRCTKEGDACSWAEADPAAFERSIELGEMAARRINIEGPHALAEWLAAVQGVVETGATKAGAYFRVEGGRRVWVLPAQSEWRGGGSRRAVVPTVVGATSTAAVSAATQVVGEDMNGDGKINQRDGRRALVLDPVAGEGIAAEGADVAAILEASDAYKGRVDYLADEAADVAAFGTWEEYDVIHVASHGLVDCEEGEDEDFCFGWGLVTGETLFVGDLDEEGRAEKQSELESIGVDIAVSEEEEDIAWSLAVSGDFFKWAYFNGLERKIVYLSACSSTTSLDLEDGILGTVWVPGRSSVLLGWDGSVTFEDAHRAAVAFFEILVGEGLSFFRSYARLRQQGLIYSSPQIPEGFVEDIASRRVTLQGYSDENPRAREIPALVDRRRAKLKDGDDLARFLKGVPGDGKPDTLTMIAEIEGMVDDNEDTGLVAGTLSSDVLHTQAWLELDGRPLMDPEPLFGKPRVDKSVRVDFDDVALGFDVEEGKTYELEVVVDLPAESYEEGESRYSAKLETQVCNVPSQGDYQGMLGGERARVIEPRSRGAFAKILRSPLGGWALQLESRERGGRDLNLLLSFDQAPEPGTTVTLQDASIMNDEFPIGGGVDRFDPDRHASWHTGSIRITFDAVKSPEGKRFKWVCGRVEGQLSGFVQKVPPGATQPIPVSGTFDGSFQAEWMQR